MSSPLTYHAGRRSAFSRSDCDAAVGRSASLLLTGTVTGAGESAAGPYVRFEIDERFGLAPGMEFVIDLDALTVEADDA